MSHKTKFPEIPEGVNIGTSSDGRRMLHTLHKTRDRDPSIPGSMSRFYNGQTAFYRHPDAMEQMIQWAEQQQKDVVRMLVMPSSIGCEPYTFAMMAENSGSFNGSRKLQIDTFDISDTFLKVAKAGAYPIEALIGLPPELTQHFTLSADGQHAAVTPEIKEQVNFLTHCSLKKFKASEPYDIVVSQNFLKHVRKELWEEPKKIKELGYKHPQAQAIKNLCDLTVNGGLLFVDMVEETPFAFHYESAPFNPFEENEMIYLDANLQPYADGKEYPIEYEDFASCIRGRSFVHALQKVSLEY